MCILHTFFFSYVYVGTHAYVSFLGKQIYGTLYKFHAIL